LGYYITNTDGEFLIPPQNIDAAYRALCALNDRDELKSGGAWGGGHPDARDARPEGMDHHPARWFSWLPPNYPTTCTNAEEVFTALGFGAYTDEDGLHVAGYDDKTGDQEHFLAAVAPFCSRLSSLDFRGECGEMWRYSINDEGGLVVWESKITYTNPRNYADMVEGDQ
jgi:hypothetical protein